MSTSAPEQQIVESGPTIVDYFGFQATKQFPFPDGVQFIEFEIMNEGKKAQFQRMTTRDLVVQRGGDARMKMDPAAERWELIKASVIGWNLYRGGSPIQFTVRNLDDFLKLADPKLIEDLEKAIRKANPWLMSEMSVKDIDREIESLRELREIAEERERGEASSSSK